MQEVVSSNPVENGAFILLLSSLTFQLITSALDEVPKEGAPLLITWKFKNGFQAVITWLVVLNNVNKHTMELRLSPG